MEYLGVASFDHKGIMVAAVECGVEGAGGGGKVGRFGISRHVGRPVVIHGNAIDVFIFSILTG